MKDPARLIHPFCRLPIPSLTLVYPSDLIVALDYDLLFPPTHTRTRTPTPPKTLQTYAILSLMNALPQAILTKPSLSAWIENITSPLIPGVIREVLIQGMRGVWPRCADRLFGRERRAISTVPAVTDDHREDVRPL